MAETTLVGSVHDSPVGAADAFSCYLSENPS